MVTQIPGMSGSGWATASPALAGRPQRIRIPEGFGWGGQPIQILWRPGVSVTYSLRLPKIEVPKVAFHVSALGNDNNTGRRHSPLLTMGRARSLLQGTGGGTIVLDGSTVKGWGNISLTVPVRILGNGSTVIRPTSFGVERVLWFGNNYHMSDLTIEGGEVLAVGTGIVGITEDCVFRNSPRSGIEHNGSYSQYYVLRCESHNHKSDGFSYMSYPLDTPVWGFEAYSSAHDNGDPLGGSSDQGSTTHAGVRVIRLGCDYRNNNINVCDVGTTNNLMVECIGEVSKNNTVNLCVGGAVGNSTETWVYGGSFRGGAYYDIQVFEGSALYTTLDLAGYSIAPDSPIFPL
ncbi:MAG: hypothetical protein ACR2NP_19605 [Pirellulaceae bacterium]